jgi:hypothetical protein
MGVNEGGEATVSDDGSLAGNFFPRLGKCWENGAGGGRQGVDAGGGLTSSFWAVSRHSVAGCGWGVGVGLDAGVGGGVDLVILGLVREGDAVYQIRPDLLRRLHPRLPQGNPPPSPFKGTPYPIPRSRQHGC